MIHITRISRVGAFWLLLAAYPLFARGQPIAARIVSIEVHGMPLSQVLDRIGEQAHFAFSYNSSILHGDSLVSATFRERTVQQVLDELLGKDYAYIEERNYLIMLRFPAGQPVRENTYWVTGHILDKYTGHPVVNASVYAKAQLQGALTDQQGFFKLRLKAKYVFPVLTISKEWYTDTAIVIPTCVDQDLTIAVVPATIAELSPVIVAWSGMERSWWGRFFLSSRQHIQSLNLSHFFTSRTSQVSLLPWIGTHGRMSGQVTNELSLNIIGGYSAGVKGVELAGAFNIDKKDVHSVQVAGGVNLAGGNVRGVQLAGVVNYVTDSLKGLQIAGLANVVKGNVRGVQLAGYLNICKDTIRGLQVSAIANRAGLLKGVQIGLINRADSSTGYSIGLISVVKHGGVHRVSVSVADVTGVTVEYIQGNQNLNSIFLVGYNPWGPEKEFSYGYGVGKPFRIAGNWGVYLEATGEVLYATRRFEGIKLWANPGTLARLQPALTFRLGKQLRIFTGPTFSFFNGAATRSGLRSGLQPSDIPGKGPLSVTWGQHAGGWIGMRAGISIF